MTILDWIFLFLTGGTIYRLYKQTWTFTFKWMSVVKSMVYMTILMEMMNRSSVFTFQKSNFSDYVMISFFILFTLETWMKDKCNTVC
ncbi:MAG: hypothetical protein ACPGSD_01560 [Flavobacteriales bacterium]